MTNENIIDWIAAMVWSQLMQGSYSLLMIDLSARLSFAIPEPERHHQPYLAVTVPAQNPPPLCHRKSILSWGPYITGGNAVCAICYLIHTREEEEWSTCLIRESAHFRKKTMKMKYLYVNATLSSAIRCSMTATMIVPRSQGKPLPSALGRPLLCYATISRKFVLGAATPRITIVKSEGGSLKKTKPYLESAAGRIDRRAWARGGAAEVESGGGEGEKHQSRANRRIPRSVVPPSPG
ncbi:hypothetical protein BJY52DRAFT_944302 [Lactarius psammicola]|nr:hypothetical protein BJY52DRAFT_944302 [Lactarius psammicola]